MTVVGGTDTRDRPFANWTNGQLLLLVLTLLISIFVINFLLLALQVCLPGDRQWDMQIAIFANPRVLSPRPQLTANSLTSVGGTDACDQLCYWDSKDPWAQCHIIDYLSLLGPSGHFRYCDQLSSPQLTANSLTSVGGTDACGQLCYWDPKDHWAQLHIVDHLSLPSSFREYLLWSTVSS